MLAGKLNIDRLAIENPEGYQHPVFLEAGRTFMALKTSSLLSDTVEFQQITLDGITVVLEQKGLTNNIQQILSNLPKGDEPAPEPDETAGKTALQAPAGTDHDALLAELDGRAAPQPERAY